MSKKHEKCPPEPKMAFSDVLFYSQPKNNQLTVIEEEKNCENIHI